MEQTDNSEPPNYPLSKRWEDDIISKPSIGPVTETNTKPPDNPLGKRWKKDIIEKPDIKPVPETNTEKRNSY